MDNSTYKYKPFAAFVFIGLSLASIIIAVLIHHWYVTIQTIVFLAFFIIVWSGTVRTITLDRQYLEIGKMLGSERLMWNEIKKVGKVHCESRADYLVTTNRLTGKETQIPLTGLIDKKSFFYDFTAHLPKDCEVEPNLENILFQSRTAWEKLEDNLLVFLIILSFLFYAISKLMEFLAKHI